MIPWLYKRSRRRTCTFEYGPESRNLPPAAHLVFFNKQELMENIVLRLTTVTMLLLTAATLSSSVASSPRDDTPLRHSAAATSARLDTTTQDSNPGDDLSPEDSVEFLQFMDFLDEYGEIIDQEGQPD